jgi:hypothetical protein
MPGPGGRCVIAKVEWHPGELYPRVGYIVTNMTRPAERGFVAIYPIRARRVVVVAAFRWRVVDCGPIRLRQTLSQDRPCASPID